MSPEDASDRGGTHVDWNEAGTLSKKIGGFFTVLPVKTPVARMERSAMRERPILRSSSLERQYPDFASASSGLRRRADRTTVRVGLARHAEKKIDRTEQALSPLYGARV